MRVLSSVTPTPEQLRIISRTLVGVEVIRGAAGSGKTTTAIFRLRGLAALFANRRQSIQSQEPVRALILTYNRTLRGYVDQLAAEQAALEDNISLTVDTFGHWAYETLGRPLLARDEDRRAQIQLLGRTIPLDPKFLCDEVEYIGGLYLPGSRHEYLTARRDGRGASPRIDSALRQRILNEVVLPYQQWKTQQRLQDWSDLEVEMATATPQLRYDIIIADETQDFSANQIRAVLNHRATQSAVILILDSAQRIYARGFSWGDVGIRLTPNSFHRLVNNYRNTAQIARFAAPLVEGITLGDADATIPNLTACRRSGALPQIVVGKFNQQMAHAISQIRQNVNLQNESVAFLHPAGWFDAVKQALTREGLPYVEITRRSEWPSGPENIALSTIHSAKGLEFDHVFLLGLNELVLQHGSDPNDDEWTKLRRLLAMGVTRAKTSVCLGYKMEERSDLMNLFEAGTFEEILL